MFDPSAPTACLLLIGNELLSGRTRDRNLAFIGRRLAALGISLREARVIADDTHVIVHNVNDTRQRFDYVFTTGGIGPTHDDITAAAVAKAFGVDLEKNPAAEQALRDFYDEQINEARLKMAKLPAGAELIGNPLSGAPGFQIGNVFVLAGIPSVMQAMFDSLADRMRRGVPILSRTLTTDRREGDLASGLADLQARFPEVSIGSYPFFTSQKKGVNIVLRGTDAGQINDIMHELRILVDELGGLSEEKKIDDTM